MYHLSPWENKDSILKEGITTNNGRVYVCSKYDEVLTDWDFMDKDLALFEFNVEGVKLHEDKEYSEDGFAYYIEEPIADLVLLGRIKSHFNYLENYTEIDYKKFIVD